MHTDIDGETLELNMVLVQAYENQDGRMYYVTSEDGKNFYLQSFFDNLRQVRINKILGVDKLTAVVSVRKPIEYAKNLEILSDKDESYIYITKWGYNENNKPPTK